MPLPSTAAQARDSAQEDLSHLGMVVEIEADLARVAIAPEDHHRSRFDVPAAQLHDRGFYRHPVTAEPIRDAVPQRARGRTHVGRKARWACRNARELCTFAVYPSANGSASRAQSRIPTGNS